MRFTLLTGLGGTADYHQIARTAESAGFHSMGVPDSLFYPEITESDYPYMDTNAVRQVLDGVPVLEPFIAMAGMAAVTERLRFYPAVMKVPVRQPLVLAKALSSLAVASGGRVSLGAGLSPWKEDFTFNGVDFDQRGKLFDECLHIIRAAMSGDYFEYESEHFNIGRCKLSPVPDTAVPMLIGGHAKPALRRAARLGDGWISANSDYDTLKGLLQTLAELRREHGTDQKEGFEIHAFDVTARKIEDYQRLEALGVTDICVNPWNAYDPDITLEKKLAGIQRFAEGIIHRYP
ncbi:TIGR03619 family F420-dependent LLM class oxidoreductase [Pseudohalioglobus lutimaris]|uniref:TIGR03619 family F420-dependent LLM class oxidoreductase n=1 Tax=Pseudohalioglobus lutimaris TaxID=1737061 RepID=A0A2N5X2S3_9GAMM|nr:TIGR03619 family F420-dependent LLM class oxidoreductase [Pseudohalioglobus lutimaris]PLW68794.1 TIGR03619 family F420-dependent LLM class oxidoreductase [Pseudohalioglobus lutimaris]